MGSHVFLIIQAQIRGREAALAVCLPPGFSDLASDWTFVSAARSHLGLNLAASIDRFVLFLGGR